MPDADALALAAAKRAQTVPLAEALHAVLFRGKDAAVSEADPKPQGPRAVLPLNADDRRADHDHLAGAGARGERFDGAARA